MKYPGKEWIFKFTWDMRYKCHPQDTSTVNLAVELPATRRPSQPTGTRDFCIEKKTNALALSRLPFQPCPWASCHNSQPHSLHLATVLCCRLLKISDPRPCVDIQSWFNGSVSLPQQPAWSLQLVVQFIRCDLAMLRAGVIYGFQASHSHERKSKCHQKVCTLEIFTKRQRCSVLPRG